MLHEVRGRRHAQLDRPRRCAVERAGEPRRARRGRTTRASRGAACVRSTYAFANLVPHGDTGWGSSVDVDSFHGAPGFARSQRLPPITIPPAPPRIAYSSLFGASSFHVVTIVRPRPEESRSTKSTERSARNVRVARARNAAPGFGAQRPRQRKGDGAKRAGARDVHREAGRRANRQRASCSSRGRKGAPRFEAPLVAVPAISSTSSPSTPPPVPADDRRGQAQRHSRTHRECDRELARVAREHDRPARWEDRRRSFTGHVRRVRRRGRRAVVVLKREERDRSGGAEDREQRQQTAHGPILPRSGPAQHELRGPAARPR